MGGRSVFGRAALGLGDGRFADKAMIPIDTNNKTIRNIRHVSATYRRNQIQGISINPSSLVFRTIL